MPRNVGRPTTIGDSVLVFEMVKAVAKYHARGHVIESKKDPAQSAIGLATKEILARRPAPVEVELEGAGQALEPITMNTVRHAWNTFGKQWHGASKRGAPRKSRKGKA